MESKLKIVHTESHREWGGQERRVFSEGLWMDRKGHHVVVVAPAQSPLYDRAGEQGWETHAVSFNKFGMIKDACFLRKLLRNMRPDVLNTHGNIDSKVGLCAAWGLGIPCVIRTRHSTPAVSNSWYNRLLYRKLCHHIFTTADCITRQIINDLDVPQDRIATIPSGIDCPDGLIDRRQARHRLANEIGVESDSAFVGFVGRLSGEKGLHVLIDAFAIIEDQLPRHHLVIVGEGGLFAALQEQIRERKNENRVHLLGYRDDPWPYFRAFDCHVLASLEFEGVPQAMLQAMFAGCPVIGTQAGGIPDIVIDRETGLLVPPDNPQRLSEAILKIIQEPEDAEKRAARARQYVWENHTIDAMGEKILRVYRMQLSEKTENP